MTENKLKKESSELKKESSELKKQKAEMVKLLLKQKVKIIDITEASGMTQEEIKELQGTM
jgi:hypothetical protein